MRTKAPGYPDFDLTEYVWDTKVYGRVKQIVQDNLPTPLGKEVQLSTGVDTNLFHDYTPG